jgi:hypothetical protein
MSSPRSTGRRSHVRSAGADERVSPRPWIPRYSRFDAALPPCLRRHGLGGCGADVHTLQGGRPSRAGAKSAHFWSACTRRNNPHVVAQGMGPLTRSAGRCATAAGVRHQKDAGRGNDGQENLPPSAVRTHGCVLHVSVMGVACAGGLGLTLLACFQATSRELGASDRPCLRPNRSCFLRLPVVPIDSNEQTNRTCLTRAGFGLVRSPQWCGVERTTDGTCHVPAPGSREARRWQDIPPLQTRIRAVWRACSTCRAFLTTKHRRCQQHVGPAVRVRSPQVLPRRCQLVGSSLPERGAERSQAVDQS